MQPTSFFSAKSVVSLIGHGLLGALLLSTLSCFNRTDEILSTDESQLASDSEENSSTSNDDASSRCGTLAEAAPMVVGYIPTWGRGPGTIETLDWETLTHLNISFGNPKSEDDATIDFGIEKSTLKSWVEEAHSHDVKVLMSLAGFRASDLVRTYLEEEKRDLLIDSLEETLVELDLDGVDVDIEGSAVDITYAPFVQALADRIRPQGKLVTAAIGAWFQDSIKDPALFCFDFINIMSYDKFTPTGAAGEHSPYLTAVSELLYWKTSRGYPAERIVLGLPFYGYCWGAGCDKKYPTYRDLVNTVPASIDTDYIVESDYTISHNTQATIARKVELGKDYGGVMIWELSQDKQGELSLMKTIKDTLALEPSSP